MRTPITWQQVPGWFDFDDVYQAAVDRAPPAGAHFVEVGVLLGKSTLFMADAIQRSGKQISFDAVDTFVYGPAGLSHCVNSYRDRQPDSDCSLLPLLLAIARERDHLGTVEHVVELSGLGALVRVVRSSGQARAPSYPDQDLDFVYVDAQHTYDDTSQILRAFVPKLRPGGILAGHDYNEKYKGVRDAVHDVLGDQIEVRRLSFVWTKP